MVRFKTVAMALSAVLLGSALVACNTMSGLGEDIQAGGKGLTHVADKIQGKDQKAADKTK